MYRYLDYLADNVKEKYQEIVDDLIERSFPKLKDTDIQVNVSKIRGGGSMSVNYRSLALKVDSSKYPMNKCHMAGIKGAFAHELVHFENLLSWGGMRKSWFDFMYSHSEAYRIKVERATDKKVVDKGLGRKLYINRTIRFRDADEGTEKIKHRYMSPAGIKRYAKKIGKW